MSGNYYCKYCGVSSSSVTNLTGGMCSRHPNGSHSGHHAPYQGGNKSTYTCQFCGTTNSSIQNLTAGVCLRHPNGAHKGHHEPML